MAAGFVLWDGHDIPILASATQLCYGDVLIAEAITLCEGLRQALCKGYDTIHVKGDSLLLIQAINGKMHAPWRIKLLMLDIYSEVGWPLCSNHVHSCFSESKFSSKCY